MRNLYDYIPGAPNFQYREFIRSNTATRYNINNTPNETQWQKIEKVSTNILQPVRKKFGPIRITSGFRSPELCILIGSSIHSNHTRGEAVDFEPVNTSINMLDIVKFIYLNFEFRTLIFEYPPEGWIHVDYRTGGNLKRLKLKDSKHNYDNVSLDYLTSLYG